MKTFVSLVGSLTELPQGHRMSMSERERWPILFKVPKNLHGPFEMMEPIILLS